ncbi:uncharacterized protein LOC129791573 [Lutzomyia longipalpis]|uniref:uncharacterized protein LOC129791573 n=1 Tax=Lutzomyia longipalpis TaxID=7200 RepID=UPI002483873A|nr:uncharacterized protein LOC129791573 [Lutzomyia longipalpis]
MPSFFKSVESSSGPQASSFKLLAKLHLKQVRALAKKDFLLKCRRFGLFPPHISNCFNCLNNTLVTSSPFTDRWERIIVEFKNKTLNLEIKQVHWELKQLDKKKNSLVASLRGHESLSTFVQLQEVFMNRKLKRIVAAQEGKINGLKSRSQDFAVSSTSDWLINLTDKTIPHEATFLLSLGPKMGLPLDSKGDVPLPQMIAEIESIVQSIDSSEEDLNRLRSEVTGNIKNFFHKNKRELPHEKRLKIAKQITSRFLKDNPDIIVTRSDKGNKSVVMSKEEYLEKMRLLVGDQETYKLSHKDLTTFYQTKNNELVSILFEGGHFDLLTKRSLMTYKALPPRIYGLPKIHKSGVPLRPIVSCIGSPTHALSKFCSDILKNLTFNSPYNVKNSFEFVDRISQHTIEDDEIIVSFDVVSLFTNIPRSLVLEVIERDWSAIERHTTIPFCLFKRMVSLIMQSGFFKFRGQFYAQLEGMPMGGCLSPVVADIVLDHVISEALRVLPSPPKLITKYVDDLFLILKRDEIDNTLDTFNSIHSKITFTCEREVDCCIPYLDTVVTRHCDGSLSTSWYRKPIASGRLLNYLSAHPLSQKLNTVQGFIHRVTKLTTNSEFDTKKIIFETLQENGYPKQLINKMCLRANNTTIDDPPAADVTVGENETPKQYFSLSYVPDLSERIRKTIAKFTPNITLSFKTHNTTERLFSQLKDKISLLDHTNVIYKLSCSCGLGYVGRTSRKLGQRISEHVRSLKDTTRVSSSLVGHCREHRTHSFDFDNPKILSQTRFSRHLNVMEMFFIRLQQTGLVNDRQEGSSLSPYYSPVIWQSSRDVVVPNG